MKKNIRFILSIVLFAAFAISCEREDSDKVDQDTIFAEYELFYNANEDITYARAVFHFSNIFGTRLELSDPSNVTFNGDQLLWKSGLAYYEKEYTGFVNSGTFVWKDTDGNTFTNQVSINEIDYPAVGFDTLPKSASYELFWDGDSLAALEIVTVTINGQVEGDVQVFTQASPNATSIVLGLTKLSQLGSGPGTVWMDRSYKPIPTEKTSAGAVMTGRYRPLNKSIQIID
jgi:hypothetical protein